MPGNGEPMFYRVRLVKDGKMVGVKIWKGFGQDPLTGETLERAWKWRAAVNGDEIDINEIEPQFADGTGYDVRGEAIAETDYDWYVADYRWARDHSPNDPSANPRKPVDMNTIDPIPW
jgi:hypothetical protein